MKIGFIGLGQMGAAMAMNLVKAGHDLAVHNRSPGKAGDLVAAGATEAATVARACEGREAVFTMLADDKAADAVVLGEGGVREALAPGAIHISSSTIGVALSAKIAQAHEAAGQLYVAAPVFGRPDAAAAAKLFVVAAGDRAAVRACDPLFEAIGQRTFVVSDRPDAANVVKLSGNFLICSVIESLGEAMALADAAGVDRHEYLELMTSTLFGAPVYKTYGALIADGAFKPARFAAPLGAKDVRLALAAADGAGVDMPLAKLLESRFETLLGRGDADIDWSALGSLSFKVRE